MPAGDIFEPADPHVAANAAAIERVLQIRMEEDRRREEEQAEEAELRKLQLVEARRTQKATTGEPGRPSKTITQETLLALFDRGLKRARSTGKRRQPSYDAIADEFGLRRTWLTPIVSWAERHQREALAAITSSKTPSRFSTIVSDSRS